LGKVKFNFKVPKLRKIKVGVPTSVDQSLKLPKGIKYPKSKKLHKKKFF
jgi:hypothetical protein